MKRVLALFALLTIAPASAQMASVPFRVAPAPVTAANPSATIGASAVNGTSSQFMRSDAAPAIGAAAVTNALLANPATTVNGATCTLGSTCSTASVLRVNLSSSQSITDSSQTTVKFDAVTTDTQSAYSTITGLATFTKAGNYLVCATVTAQAASSITASFVSFMKNGTQVSRVQVGSYSAGTAQSAPASLCDIINVNGSSDTINASIYLIGVGGSDAVTGSGVPYTFMTATYLGN